VILLIHPPVAKPAESPAGIGRLSGMLLSRGIKHRVLDANLEGLLYLLLSSERPKDCNDAWTRRAFLRRGHGLASIKGPGLYHLLDRYKRTVKDLTRVLEVASASQGVNVSLSNYQSEALSPLRSGDLIAASELSETNLFYPYFRTRLTELMNGDESQFIGFSLNYLSQALCAFAMIGFLKREFPAVKILLGGGLVTSWLKGTSWNNPFSGLVDHLVAGPGENQLLSILGAGATKQTFYSPDYRALPVSDYLSPGFILPYSASSGCYWNKCSFCPEKAEGSVYVPVPSETVISDLKRLKEQREPVLIHFLDSAVSLTLMQALSKKPPGAPWYGFARIDRHLTDLDFCRALKRSGCVMLKLGLESGDQSVLDKMRKGIDLDTASRALKSLKKAGIAAYVYLIFGTPEETPNSARKTLTFIARHYDSIDFLNLAIFNMPVCSAEASVQTRKFFEGDLSLYTDFLHPKGWNRKEVRSFLGNEFRRHPVVSAILKKEPPVFTSNHASFFVMNCGALASR